MYILQPVFTCIHLYSHTIYYTPTYRLASGFIFALPKRFTSLTPDAIVLWQLIMLTLSSATSRLTKVQIRPPSAKVWTLPNYTRKSLDCHWSIKLWTSWNLFLWTKRPQRSWQRSSATLMPQWQEMVVIAHPMPNSSMRSRRWCCCALSRRGEWPGKTLIFWLHRFVLHFH